ncbi:MAG TPA: response regulator [Terriglobales bacterium]|nr:response regulator [Terriglobales bacterium]
MVGERKSVLCIDDYETAAAGWCLFLQSVGYAVTTAFTAQEGLHLFATSPVDLVMLDYAMPDLNGGEVAATMKRIKPHVPILLFSGLSQVPDPTLVHVDAFLQKGVAPATVLEKIKDLLGHTADRLD